MSATDGVDGDLVRRLTDEVIDRLPVDPPATNGDRAAALAREAEAAYVLVARLDAYAKERVGKGLPPLSPQAEDVLADRVRAQLFGLAELDRLVRDSGVENVFINGADVLFRRHADGRKERGDPIVGSDDALIELIRQAAATHGRSERRFDVGQPWVSFRLADGSRLTAVREVSGRPVVALRRFGHRHATMADLERLGTVSPVVGALLSAAVRAKRNILVVGGTDAGKTTLLRALINEIGPEERLVTVEDALELQVGADPERHPDVVELECREENIEGEGAVAMRDLTRLALRLSPDRVIVGEARGPEILDMFQAMSQGNDGSMGTLHARSTADAFVQITRYALKAPEHLSPEAVAVDIAASLDLVVHVHKLPGGTRAVSSIREVVGYDGAMVVSNEVFAPGPEGTATPTGAPLRDRTRDALGRVGFDAALLVTEPGAWVR